MGRKIIHVDMDAFYASVEQRDRPELRGRPVVVGGEPGSRGVVAAASYEARRFGIRSAMPSSRAGRLCPHAVFVRPRMKVYVAEGRRIREIFRRVTELVEPLSIDEAYLDVTENALGLPYARDVAKWLKATIREETGLTASAGVGPNKLVAKIASDLRKPDGLVVVPTERMKEFLDPLPVEKIWGVGPRTAERLHKLGLTTFADVGAADPALLEQRLGKWGPFLVRLARGDDPRRVTTHREAKSSGAERTFAEDVGDLQQLFEVVGSQAERVAASLKRMEKPGRTVTLKVRYADFTTITRSRTLPEPTDDAAEIAEAARELLAHATEAGRRKVRLVGVSVSGLVRDGEPLQLTLPL